MEGRIFRKRYRLKSRLGSGSFGTAWLVADERRKDEEHVMKQIFVGMLEPDDTVDALKEARLLGQLKHPNIVALKEAFIEEQFVCIVTECVAQPLADDHFQTSASPPPSPQEDFVLRPAPPLPSSHAPWNGCPPPLPLSYLHRHAKKPPPIPSDHHLKRRALPHYPPSIASRGEVRFPALPRAFSLTPAHAAGTARGAT